MKEYKDTVQLFIFTLDLVTKKYPIITAVENLPHDCLSILPCAPSLGGVIVVASNALIYVDQASRKTVLPVNGWAPRISDSTWQALRPDEQDRNLQLEGASAIFMDEHTFFVILQDGTVYPVEIMMDGKIVARLSMGAALAQTTIPSNVTSIGKDWLFVGSTVAASVILKATRVEEEVPREEQGAQSPAAVVDAPRTMMDIDDDDGMVFLIQIKKHFPDIKFAHTDIYGDIIKDNGQAAPSAAGGNVAAVELRSVIHLSLCDSLPAHGPIVDMTFALTRNGVSGLWNFRIIPPSLPTTLASASSDLMLPFFTCL